MTQTDILIEHGFTLVKICNSKAEALRIFNRLNSGTLAPHYGEQWGVFR
jgi:hypothetical protein